METARFCLFVTVLVAFFCSLTDGAKIVVYSPTITKSHMQMHAQIADTLAADGHDVTVAEVEYLVDPKAVNFVRTAKRRVFPLPQPRTTLKPDMAAVLQGAFQPTTFLGHFEFVRRYERVFQSSCEKHVNEGEVLRWLQEEKFDFVLTEHVDLCGSAMSFAAGIRTHVLVSTCPLFEHTASLLGLESSAAYVPSFVPGTRSLTGGFWERAENAIGWFVDFAGLRYGSRLVTETFRRKFGPHFPDVDQIVSESTALTLVNADEFLDFPRPTFHDAVNIGGLGLKQQEAKRNTSDPLAEVFERGRKGVVFFSLGSVTTTRFLPPAFMPHLVAAMEAMPEWQFVVKVDAEDVPLLSSSNSSQSNVHFVSWVDQRALLAHPNVRLFVTHAGQNSIAEAAFAATPLLLLPFFVDQHRNAAAVERNGWGRVFEKRSLLHGSTELVAAMTEMLEDPRFAENAARLSKILNGRPTSAEQRLRDAVRLLELADGRLPELQSASRRMSLIQRHNWDVLAVLVAFGVLLLQVACFLVFKLVLRLRPWVQQAMAFVQHTMKLLCKREKFGRYEFVGDSPPLDGGRTAETKAELPLTPLKTHSNC